MNERSPCRTAVEGRCDAHPHGLLGLVGLATPFGEVTVVVADGVYGRRRSRTNFEYSDTAMTEGQVATGEEGLASERLSLITSAERPVGVRSPLHDEPPIVSPPSVVPACCMYREPTGMLMRAIATIWCWRSRM